MGSFYISNGIVLLSSIECTRLTNKQDIYQHLHVNLVKRIVEMSNVIYCKRLYSNNAELQWTVQSTIHFMNIGKYERSATMNKCLKPFESKRLLFISACINSRKI